MVADMMVTDGLRAARRTVTSRVQSWDQGPRQTSVLGTEEHHTVAAAAAVAVASTMDHPVGVRILDVVVAFTPSTMLAVVITLGSTLAVATRSSIPIRSRLGLLRPERMIEGVTADTGQEGRPSTWRGKEASTRYDPIHTLPVQEMPDLETARASRTKRVTCLARHIRRVLCYQDHMASL